jgi:hypothetical protein
LEWGPSHLDVVNCEGFFQSLRLEPIGGLIMSVGNIHPDTGEVYELLIDVPLAPRPAVFEQAVQSTKVERPAAPGEPLPMLGAGDGRHPLMMVKLGKAHAAGFSEQEAVAMLLALSDERFSDPVSLEEIEQTVASCYAKWAAPEIAPEVTLGKPSTQPEAAPLPERKRPVYPISVWDGTVAGEFAKLCAHDNNIPRKFFVEAWLTILGAVVGDKLICAAIAVAEALL